MNLGESPNTKKGRMKMRRKRRFYVSGTLLLAFCAWTAIVMTVDVNTIGPLDTGVGLSGLNGFVHSLTGVNMRLYTLTDFAGLVPFCVVGGFAALGLVQWIRRRSLLRVDRSLLVLGGFYIATALTYVIFEIAVVNYRPVLIEGRLEASYPSSTTVLVLCVMPTAAMQLRSRIQNRTFGRWIMLAIFAFVLFMVAGRVLSGVHWITDIIGGILLSLGLVYLYDGVCKLERFCK
jgi:undecaprenyl-diphosphatase